MGAVGGTEQRWRAHPVLAGLLGALAFLLPIAAAVTAAVLVSRVVARPDGVVATALWWLGLSAVSSVVLVLVERVARRVLPLAALLRLCMLFPDRVPSRFRLALRSGSVTHLRRRLEEPGTTAAEAAGTVLALLAALSSHDRATRGHCERVRAYTDLLATELRLNQRDRDLLRWAALLHDIGKVAVPTRLLNKPSAPTEAEWSHLRHHPVAGAELVVPLREWLGKWGDTIEHHHERWDGAGYPKGLSGADICWGARIVAVADAFETMTSLRPYARPVSPAAARRELAACAGSHFDPDVVRAFLNVAIGRLRLVMGPLALLGQVPVIGALEGASVRVAWSGLTPTAGGVAATGVAALLLTSVAPGTGVTEVAGADAERVVAEVPSGPGLKVRPPALAAAATPAPPAAAEAPAPPPAAESAPAAASAPPAARDATSTRPSAAPHPTPPPPPAPDDDDSPDHDDHGPDHDFGGRPPGHGGTPPGHGGAVPGHGPDHEERDEDD